MGIPYRAGDAAPRARKSFDCPAENRLENQRRKWGSRAFGSEAHHADLQNRKNGSEAACLSYSNLISGRVDVFGADRLCFRSLQLHQDLFVTKVSDGSMLQINAGPAS